MTQDETIELARQAGLHVATDVNWMPVIGLDYAKKLIELAAEKEREAVLDLVDGYAKNNTDLADAIRTRGQE